MYVFAKCILLKLVEKCADDIRAYDKFAVLVWYAKNKSSCNEIYDNNTIISSSHYDCCYYSLFTQEQICFVVVEW